MSDLTITATEVAPVEVYEQITAPASEALDAGEPVRYDTTSGELTPANGTDTDEYRAVAVAIETADFANETITAVKRGILDVGDALSGMNYDSYVYLSNTDGTMTDADEASQTKIIGRVVPMFSDPDSTDKLLFVDLAGV